MHVAESDTGNSRQTTQVPVPSRSDLPWKVIAACGARRPEEKPFMIAIASEHKTATNPSAKATCLVTGATGLVGNNVVRRLLDRGWQVRALVRSGRSVQDRSLAGLPIDLVRGSLEDAGSLRQATAGVDAVIHSAAMVHCGWRHAAEMHRVNVEGTRLVAQAARQAGARLVHVSSVDAIGLRDDGLPADEETPPGGMVECPYVVTKRLAEAEVLREVDRGLEAVIVNPVYMIGPWDWKPSSGRMLLEVGSGKGLFAPPGANDFVDVRDRAMSSPASRRRWTVDSRGGGTSWAGTDSPTWMPGGSSPWLRGACNRSASPPHLPCGRQAWRAIWPACSPAGSPRSTRLRP